MDTTLLIMAAGMGSRYGGNKQVDGMGPHGEILLEYSVFDALEAGFNKIVFVIKRDMLDDFRKIAGKRIEKRARVEYAFQSFDDLPDWYRLPPERVKPFGTVHAVLSAKDVIDEPFGVLNADDYYGKGAFTIMAQALREMKPRGEAAMVGYFLRNTVSEHGYVTRGVCGVRPDGTLSTVTETYQIQPFPDGTIRDTFQDPAGVILDPNCLVSMNFFGFTPWVFGEAQSRFERFLRGLRPEELKKEYLLPVLVDDLMREEGLRVRVLSTDATWFGVTYKDDKPRVEAALRALHDRGDYPQTLL